MKRGTQDFTHEYIHREVYEKLKVAEKKWWVDRGALGFIKCSIKWQEGGSPFSLTLNLDGPWTYEEWTISSS